MSLSKNFLYIKDRCKRVKHSQASHFILQKFPEQCYAGHTVRWRFKSRNIIRRGFVQWTLCEVGK